MYVRTARLLQTCLDSTAERGSKHSIQAPSCPGVRTLNTRTARGHACAGAGPRSVLQAPPVLSTLPMHGTPICNQTNHLSNCPRFATLASSSLSLSLASSLFCTCPAISKGKVFTTKINAPGSRRTPPDSLDSPHRTLDRIHRNSTVLL